MELLEIVIKLASLGRTDAEIAEQTGFQDAASVARFRARNGIASLRGRGAHRGKKHWTKKSYTKQSSPDLHFKIEHGVKILICPSRWANGIMPQKNIGCYE